MILYILLSLEAENQVQPFSKFKAYAFSFKLNLQVAYKKFWVAAYCSSFSLIGFLK